MLPEDFESLEDAVSAFIQGVEHESDAQFYQSDVCALACIEKHRRAWGMTDEAILAHIGKQTEKSRTTMYSRLLVGRVFPKPWREAPDNAWCREGRLGWSHFEVCARTWSEADPDAPKEWLRYCADNDLSVRQLKSEIALAGGVLPETRPLYLFDGATVTLDALDDHTMTVYFAQPPNPVWGTVEPGTRIVLTAVVEREPVLAAEPAAEPA